MDAQRGAKIVRLHDVLDEIRNILDETTGLRFEAFERVWTLRRACERGIEIISEASRHVRDELKETEPAIPWRQIAGIGNVLRHNYENISARVVWDVIVNHLSPLSEAAKRLIERIEAEENGR